MLHCACMLCLSGIGHTPLWAPPVWQLDPGAVSTSTDFTAPGISTPFKLLKPRWKLHADGSREFRGFA